MLLPLPSDASLHGLISVMSPDAPLRQIRVQALRQEPPPGPRPSRTKETWMTGTVQTDRHFWLARSMARRLGVSFTAAMVEGRISAADLSLLVARCGVCAHAAACTDWLARSCASTGAAPGFCAIGAALDAIATVPPGRVEDSGGHENPV